MALVTLWEPYRACKCNEYCCLVGGSVQRTNLLDVGSKFGEGLGVRQDCPGWVTQEADIPNTAKTKQHRDVLLQRSSPEVLVHIIRACGTR